jgi:hypothetical protein
MIIDKNKLVYCSNPIIRYPYDFADINYILPIIMASAEYSDISQPGIEKVAFRYKYISYGCCVSNTNRGPRYKREMAKCDCEYIDENVSITDCPKDEYCPVRISKMIMGEWHNLPPIPPIYSLHGNL